MSGTKPYFLARIGRSLTYAGEASRPSLPPRRDYSIVPRGVDGSFLLATVSWQDVGRNGRKIPGRRGEAPIQRVSLRGLNGPAEALEDLARAADPEFFAGTAPPVRDVGAADADAIRKRLAELATVEGRGGDEIAPADWSVSRFMAFWNSHPNLIVPDIFSSKDGTLRARWNHGHDRMLWVNFPEKGPLGWSASFPRSGASGFRKMNARCFDEQDVIPCAELLGIKCSKGREP